jgi:hypothetical protein
MIDEKKEDCRIMLGQIGCIVEDWCISEECTTLDAVKLLHAELLELKGKTSRMEIENKYLS